MLSDEGPASLPSVDSDGIPIDEDDEDANDDDTEEQAPVSGSSRLQQVRFDLTILTRRWYFSPVSFHIHWKDKSVIFPVSVEF